MNDVNFTTNDVKSVVDYIKNIIRTKGYNYNITERDINDLPYNQFYAINKFKTRFGPLFLNNINKIYDDYIVFRGGQRTKNLSRQGKQFGTQVLTSAVTGQSTGNPFADIFGQ